MPLNIVVLEASTLVSTKTLLLKHYYRRQGIHISNFSSGMLLGKDHELACLWFGLPGRLLNEAAV